jgi:hypothetical protein
VRLRRDARTAELIDVQTTRAAPRAAPAKRYPPSMALRPLHVFSALAAAMVTWFATRVSHAHDPTVWAVSCALGGWAPVGAAVIARYVARVGHREDSVAAAWLVRALGVHCVLLWMVGASDWLRGPPHMPPAWNVDAGTPVVFLAFAPCFALSLAALRALAAAHRALVDARVTAAREASLAAHYRAPARPFAVAHRGPLADGRALAGAVGAAGVFAAATSSLPPAALTLGTAAALGMIPSARAVAPSVAALAALSALAVSRGGALAMRWPVALLAAGAVYVLVLRLRLRAA